jgi:predicted RNA-binding Zn ribbon-like protein
MTNPRRPSSEPRGLPVRLVPAGSQVLCLAYANSLCWRGLPKPSETLCGFDDLLGWCANNGVVVDPAFVRWSLARPEAAQAVFAEAIAMREMLYRVLCALSIGARIAATDLRALNKAMARTPSRTRIAQLAQGYGWRLQAGGAGSYSTPTLLAAVLWSASDLIVGEQRASLRQCANAACRWLFLDASRNGSRRWCDMRACGNQAKARRHYHKHRAA